MSNIASALNGTSVALSVGEGVSGILVKQTYVEDAAEVSFGYASPNESLNVGSSLSFDLHFYYYFFIFSATS